MQEFIDTIQNLSGPMIYYGIVTIVVLLGFGLAVGMVKGFIKRQKRSDRSCEDSLAIDIEKLPAQPMPKGGPILEFYNSPVRVALVVIAPAGTGAVTPSADRWNDAFDSVVPGLAKVINAHRPAIRTWPTQLSVSGFASKFFQHVPLPGNGGKGTTYSSVAGTFEMEDRPMLVGLVLESRAPDNHGQYTINSPSEWLGILRVREE